MKVDRQRRCIIADDVRASRELLGAWLTEFGYICTLVGDGNAAREAAENERPDLVITDIEMPRCNGLELLAAIRASATTDLSSVAMIVVSSLQDERIVDLVRQFGTTCVLSKPLEKLRVKAVVAALENGLASPQSLSHVQLQQEPSPTPAISPKLRRMAEKLTRDTR